MAKKSVNNDILLANIIKGIEEVKGNDIDILDLREIDNSACDYFIICSGNSNTQVNAIVNSIQKTVSREIKDKPWHVEGGRKWRVGADGLCTHCCTRLPATHP